MSDGEGPHCALHFDEPSLATCTRCGRFCCQSCLVEREPAFCVSCGPTVVDPYGLRGRSFDLAASFTIAFKLIIAELPTLLALVVLFSLPAAAVQVAFTAAGDDLKAAAGSLRVSNFYEVFVGLVGSQAMLAVFIARSEGRVLSFGQALNEGMQNWARAFGARFRSGLHLFAFFLLLGVPVFWKATLLMFTSIAVLRSQDRDALEASESLVRGRFWLCFGFALAAIGVCVVPMIMFDTVIGIVAEGLPISRFPLEFLSDVIGRFATDVAMTGVFYTGYVMLHRTAGIELAPMRWRSEPALATDK